MGILLVVGMMMYSVGMCLLFQRVGNRSQGARYMDSDQDHPAVGMDVPDQVPAEWVGAYRAEQGSAGLNQARTHPPGGLTTG